jgi:glycosyltransferase involved in cell wall biosynthesis
MIESSEVCHKDYAGKLNLCNEIFIASEYGKQVLLNSNIHVPIFVMPLGVDPSRYNNSVGIMDFGQAMRPFKFLSVFRWSYRKGFDLLLRAYLEEFSKNDDVSLLMVSRAVECPEDIGVNRILEDFNNIKSSVNKTEEELPHIALYTKPIKESMMPKVYNSCNAFVLISRGEGFGLPYCEAASIGLPVIGTNVTAQTDYLKPDNSFLIEPEGYVTANINGELSRMAKLCRFYEGQIFPNFHSKSMQQIKETMRYVYENYGEAQKRAKKLQSLILNNYTWDMAIDRVYNRLVQINKERK